MNFVQNDDDTNAPIRQFATLDLLGIETFRKWWYEADNFED